MFDLFDGHALITQKMVERKAFLVNPKHQCLVSQSKKHDCSAHNKRNGDYDKHPSLPYFMGEH